MKNFKEELLVLFSRLKSREPFSFSKFADGEWLMIRGIPINNNEFNKLVKLAKFYEHMNEYKLADQTISKIKTTF